MSILAAPRKRKGRRRVETLLNERRKHIAVLKDRFVRNLTIEQICEFRELSRTTVKRWTQLALTYEDDDVATIKRMLAEVG